MKTTIELLAKKYSSVYKKNPELITQSLGI